MRKAEIKRKTAETDIVLKLDLDGTGKSDVDSGVGFLDHMLTLFAKHGRFDLQLACKGDTQVDDHHSVEDIGICLGEAFAKALGDKAGIRRYGSMLLPMDEALVLSSLDISGRAHLSYTASIRARKVGTFDTGMPRSAAAFLSTTSVPVESRAMKRILLHASSTSSMCVSRRFRPPSGRRW